MRRHPVSQGDQPIHGPGWRCRESPQVPYDRGPHTPVSPSRPWWHVPKVASGEIERGEAQRSSSHNEVAMFQMPTSHGRMSSRVAGPRRVNSVRWRRGGSVGLRRFDVTRTQQEQAVGPERTGTGPTALFLPLSVGGARKGMMVEPFQQWQPARCDRSGASADQPGPGRLRRRWGRDGLPQLRLVSPVGRVWLGLSHSGRGHADRDPC